MSSPHLALTHQSDVLAGIRHREQNFDDFQREPLLLWKLSQLGPGLAVGDVNGDGADDLYLSGAAGYTGQLCIREAGGRFRVRPQECFERDRANEDMGALFFDADGDGDLDLYVVSGGVECGPGDPVLRDRLYLNDGKGNFTMASDEAWPDLRVAGSVVAAADFDRDGDLDLFVGGRFTSFKDFADASLAEIFTAPRLQAATRFVVNTLESGVLLNDGQGHFTFRPLPRLAQVAPVFGVTLTDVDADGRMDLFLVQNFFSPQPETGRMDGGLSLLLQGNGDGTFTPIWPRESGLVVPGDAKSLAVTDLNGDGWPDFVIGINDDELRTFENRAPRQNRRLNIELRGKAGNPTGIGARVRLTLASGAVRVGELHAGGGYLSQSTRILSFGLSLTDRPSRIDVRWPDGRTTSVSPVPEQMAIRIPE